VQRVISQQEWSLDNGLAQWTLIQSGNTFVLLAIVNMLQVMITSVVFDAISLYLISGNNLLLREGKF
jgi:hypothetical protein